jgi:hypothetical protein
LRFSRWPLPVSFRGFADIDQPNISAVFSAGSVPCIHHREPAVLSRSSRPDDLPPLTQSGCRDVFVVKKERDREDDAEEKQCDVARDLVKKKADVMSSRHNSLVKEGPGLSTGPQQEDLS